MQKPDPTVTEQLRPAFLEAVTSTQFKQLAVDLHAQVLEMLLHATRQSQLYMRADIAPEHTEQARRWLATRVQDELIVTTLALSAAALLVADGEAKATPEQCVDRVTQFAAKTLQATLSRHADPRPPEPVGYGAPN